MYVHNSDQHSPGTDVKILKIFSPNNLVFFCSKYCKHWIVAFAVKKKRHFFRRKLQKIVIVTLSPVTMT
jgi:hypothetical protein